jgi:hypothetical protein
MSFETLTLTSIRARPVVLKLKRPVVARIATVRRLVLNLDRSVYGEGRNRTQLSRAVHPQIDALPHPRAPRSRNLADNF